MMQQMTGYSLLNSVQRKAYVDHLTANPDDKEGLRLHKTAALRATGATRLYKYCTLTTARKIVANGLLLQAPDNYNDPFDCLAGANVWSAEYRFMPDRSDVEYALAEVKAFPSKYQLPKYGILPDMRASYYFATTCFSERHDEHLLWSHYGENHKGFCLAFDLDPLFDDVHPCLYTHSMPASLAWRSGNLALALIKGAAWAHEKEWRVIKKTIRPKMRVLGSIIHQIYNSVHANPELTMVEYEEWSRISGGLMKRLEDEYNRERVINIRPSRIFLGLNIYHQYTNVLTGEGCDEICGVSIRDRIPVSRMCVQSNSFDLVAVDVVDRYGWTQPWQ
jgi:hypothetical protein